MRKESGEGAPSAYGASLDRRQPRTVSCRRAPAELPGLPGCGDRRCRFLISWGSQNREQTRNPGCPESCSLCMCTGVVPGDPPFGNGATLPSYRLLFLSRCLNAAFSCSHSLSLTWLSFSAPTSYLLFPLNLPGFESHIPPGRKPLKGKMGGARSLGRAQSLTAPGTERTNSKFSAGRRAGALGPD